MRVWQVPEFLFQTPDKQVETACQSLVDIGAKLAFDKSDLAQYPVLASEFAQEDQLRYDPENPEIVIGLKSPCEGIVDLPPY